MLHDTVRLAQPNRKAKDLLAQKENSEFAIRPFREIGINVSRAEFFVTGAEACERRSECMYQYMID